MFGWLTERRRKRLLEQPFPGAWTAILDDLVAPWRKLDETAMRLPSRGFHWINETPYNR